MTGSNHAPAIILVEPQMGENIGAAARAMLNFGLTDMRIVKPRDGWPNDRAVSMAAGAGSVIGNARLFDSLEEAIADLQHVFATTARPRDMIKQVVTPKKAAAELHQFTNANETCGILFGKESSGLSGDDITLADTIITVPLNPDYTSINLGQAVLLVAYEWFQYTDDTAEKIVRNEERPVTKQELGALFNRIETELDARDYFAPIMNRRPIILRNMRNMFQRFAMMESDIKGMQGIVKGLSLKKKDTEK
ncbi:hypothetical protein A9Q83_08600 [Alphaproteobacteria bacterium 46_93_T64]|nr:hypothetical protein A9Q83_08600 [Alphaproteobacteria bacterium 46_93_T64]